MILMVIQQPEGNFAVFFKCVPILHPCNLNIGHHAPELRTTMSILHIGREKHDIFIVYYNSMLL